MSDYILFDGLALGDVLSDPAAPKPFRLFAVGENRLTRDGRDYNLTLTAEDIRAIADYHARKGEKIPVSRGTIWDAAEGKAREIYALEPEQVDQIRELVKSTTKVADYNQEILDIVTEQAAPFFAGQKSAEEVAKLVQSKANIYVNEQR